MAARRPERRAASVAAVTALVFVALLAAACSRAAETGAGGPGTTTTTVGTSTSVPPTTAPSTTTTTRPQPPAGGPVPSGFDPVSFTAVSASDYWLLGTAPCANPVCTSVVRTTDGGAHFVGLPAPTSPLSASGATGTIDTLRFADVLDGYAYNSRSFGADDPFWSTHDGGAHWSEPGLSGVLAFGTGGGDAFAVTASCANGTCTQVRLERSPVTEDAWVALPLPVTTVSQLVAMSVHRHSLWLSFTVLGSSVGQHQTLVVSTDAGTRFTTEPSPCVPTLGGALAASSTAVVWAVCPSGTQATALRSTDAGASWSPLGVHPLANSAIVAPADGTTAVLVTGQPGELLRTTDGGGTFATVYPPGGVAGYWAFVGFTTSTTGAALLVLPTTSQAGTVPTEQLWRTTDGGAHWSGPVAVG